MPVPVAATLAAIGKSSAATGGAAVGSGSAIGSGGGGIFGQISEQIKSKLPGLDKAQQQVQNSLNIASNLGLSIPSTFSTPEIDPGLGGAIDKSVFDFAGLADNIIEQSGLKDLINELQPAKTTETEETAKTKETAAADTTPTQGANKPVEKAGQSREEGRTNLEQLFLDLINGKLDIKL